MPEIEKNMRVFPVVDDAEKLFEKLEKINFRTPQLPPQNKRIVPGVGDVVSDAELNELKKIIKDEAKKYGFPSSKPATDSLKTEFDKKLGEILFTKMNITPSVAATLAMWHFFSIYLIPDVIYWRWGASKDHFISTRRNYCGTQWWRYYLFSASKETLWIFKKIPDNEIADLYERSGTSGLPHHITDIAIWFDELDEANVTLDSRQLRRETIKLYNAELGYRNYFALTEEKLYELFKNAYKRATELV